MHHSSRHAALDEISTPSSPVDARPGHYLEHFAEGPANDRDVRRCNQLGCEGAGERCRTTVLFRLGLMENKATWGRLSKKAYKRYTAFHLRNDQVEAWHEELLAVRLMPVDAQVRPDHNSNAHVCVICTTAFSTPQGWFSHAYSRHGYRSKVGTAAQGAHAQDVTSAFAEWVAPWCHADNQQMQEANRALQEWLRSMALTGEVMEACPRGEAAKKQIGIQPWQLNPGSLFPRENFHLAGGGDPSGYYCRQSSRKSERPKATTAAASDHQEWICGCIFRRPAL